MRSLGRIRNLVVLLGLSLIAASSADAQEHSDTLEVFFLGNSYIYFNNLPGLVEALSAGLPGPLVRTASHTHGGFTLRRHIEDGHFPAAMAMTGSSRVDWDVVVLQEQSALAVPTDTLSGRLGSPAAFQESVRDLASTIRQGGAEPVLYMTWAKQRWPDQTTQLADAYRSIGAELGAPVAPVGVAWAATLERRPDLTLHVADGSHPNAVGSYLAACVFYATLTGRSPVGGPPELHGVPWNFVGPVDSDSRTILVSLPSDDAEFLQRLAWEVVDQSHRSSGMRR